MMPAIFLPLTRATILTGLLSLKKKKKNGPLHIIGAKGKDGGRGAYGESFQKMYSECVSCQLAFSGDCSVTSGIGFKAKSEKFIHVF